MTPSPMSLFRVHKTSDVGNSEPNVGRGTRAAVVGAVMGLVTVIGLGSLLSLPDYGPNFALQFAGKIALILVYASPYLFALAASRAERPGTRGGLLLAFGLLSLVASFSSLSLVTLTLLPATIVILFAAARSLTASIRPTDGHPDCGGPGIGGCRNGRPESLYALRSPRPGDPMLGVDSKRRRTIRVGGPAAQPQ